MRLHVEHRGTGPALVLLHGWGFHSGIWQSLAERLEANFRVILVDLPGHGRSDSLASNERLEAVAEMIAAAVPASAFWLGWSLGGLVALQVAIRRPEQVNRLVLVASTPRFVAALDWPDAIASTAVAGLFDALKEDSLVALKRFVLLQLRGSKRAKEAAQILFAQLTPSTHASEEGLSAGLALLRDSDLRAHLPAVRCPTLLLMGARDPLVPAKIGDWMLAHLPQGRRCTFPEAGHAPFLSHPGLFQQVLENFLRDNPRSGK